MIEIRRYEYCQMADILYLFYPEGAATPLRSGHNDPDPSLSILPPVFPEVFTYLKKSWNIIIFISLRRAV
jgi:hypothetical protein